MYKRQVNNFAKPEDLAKERKRFTKENLQGEGGVLLFPNTYSEIQQIKSSPFIDVYKRQQLYLHAFGRLIKELQARGKKTGKWKTPGDVMAWWMEENPDQTMLDGFEDQDYGEG